MAHTILVALTIIAVMSPLMTLARPTYPTDVGGKLSSDNNRRSHSDDVIQSSFKLPGGPAVLATSGDDGAEKKPADTTTGISPENLQKKLLELNNLDRSGAEARGDGLLARLAADQSPVYDRMDADGHTHVPSRRRRSVTDTEDLPEHYRRHISQPPIPFDDGNNVHGRSVCPWRYEDDTRGDRFPHTLRVAVKTQTGSRCIDPATGAPRVDLLCLPVEYKLNVLRKDSAGVWQVSSDPEFVTVGYTCARSRTE